ncbi:DinB family protein [Paenibacillus sp. D2_2]|uniref:DinB family protein n=1 Tax=Paenibacillus sp. D2_2 TaxID=3073092 RepID=UPI00281564AA|nr:DinB family protein [Paenibacillus sp. D2_2]WMT43506.1 DinB family protein [Paenibacillus sp. D2_2]
MRSTQEALQEFEATVERYLLELDNLDLKQTLQKPNEEEWSIGQMYMHLIQSAQYMQLQHVDQCLTESNETLAHEEEKTEQGRIIFEQGSFPPIRIRVPASPQYTPQQPESKEQLTEGLHSVVERMRRTEPALSQASLRHKIAHPRFGALNAKEWFLLVEMHYRHHLSQLERLKMELSSTNKV